MSFKTYTLGEIASNTSRRFNFNDKEQVCFVNTGDILDGHFLVDEKVSSIGLPGQAKKAIQKGDILYSEIRPGNKRHLLVNTDVDDYVVSTKFMVITCNHDVVIPEYLYLVLTSKECEAEFKVIADSRSGTFPQITFDAVAYYPIELPNLIQQRAVVEFIKSITGKLNLNNQTNQTLEQMAQAIFKSWFVDFDPVKAKMNGEQPEGMDAATASLFPDKLVESELGLIPEGWQLTNVGKVSECFDKHRIPLSKRQREQKQGIIPYYGATSVMDFVDEAIFDDIYLLLGEDGSVVKEDGTPFIQYIWGPAWVNNHAHVLKGIKSVSTEQLMLFFQQTNINAYVTGAVQLKINQKNMNSIPFIKASEDINERFYEVIAPLYAKVRAIKEENEQLAKLRDSLLPKLLSGEIELGTSEELVEAI